MSNYDVTHSIDDVRGCSLHVRVTSTSGGHALTSYIPLMTSDARGRSLHVHVSDWSIVSRDLVVIYRLPTGFAQSGSDLRGGRMGFAHARDHLEIRDGGISYDVIGNPRWRE